jgi:hypothetical protein
MDKVYYWIGYLTFWCSIVYLLFISFISILLDAIDEIIVKLEKMVEILRHYFSTENYADTAWKVRNKFKK